MTKQKDEGKLSPLAKKAEVTLRKVLDAIARDIDEVERAGVDRETGESRRKAKYSLTDLMKITDRALKLEAIRLSVKNDDEGSFFTNPGSDESDDEGANDE